MIFAGQHALELALLTDISRQHSLQSAASSVTSASRRTMTS